MTRFQAGNDSDAVVGADRAAIWAVLVDPVLLPRLTPLLRRIDVQPGGELWTWHLSQISALGVSLTAAFTERMTFLDTERIEFHHDPPASSHERAGAEGWYDLSDDPAGRGTRLRIHITLTVDLPLPRAAAPAVERVMRATMTRMGDRFSTNLLAHLGV